MPSALTDATLTEPTVTEATIAELVERFYGRARRDPLLGPVFEAAIDDWDGHLARIRDFWSHHLLGTGHHGGHPFMAHAVLPIEPAHFDRWLALFAETAAELLPPPFQERALARANHMAASFKVGMFTVPGHRFGVPR